MVMIYLPFHRQINVRKNNTAVITVILVYAPTTNAEEAEVEWFPEKTVRPSRTNTKKGVLFIIGEWDSKVGSQEIPGVTGKFGLEVQNEAGKKLTEFS